MDVPVVDGTRGASSRTGGPWAGRARAGHCSGGEADQSVSSLHGLEQPPRGEHLFQDEGLERESVRLGESCRPEEGEARRELGLPSVQLEGGRGGVVDR